MTEKIERAHIAVLGCGPAGATFARELSQRRPTADILVLSDESKPKLCGGLLAPDAQKVLARFGLTLPRDVLADPQIFAVETTDLVTGLTRLYPRHYLNMHRDAFDQWLASLIPPQVRRLDARCLSVTQQENGFLLRTTAGDVQADFLVGADGARSLVRRAFFPTVAYQYVSVQQWFAAEGKKLPPYACIFDADTSDSCSWAILKEDRVLFGGAFLPRACRERFEKQKKRFEEKTGVTLGEPIQTDACLLTSPRRWRDFLLGCDRAFLTGEAAGLISASSFEGISSAMRSGRDLAEAFARYADDEKRILHCYRALTRSLRVKLYFKTKKRAVICSPMLRTLILKSGWQSVRRYDTQPPDR